MADQTYAALLREVARIVRNASELRLRDPRVQQLLALADLLERVTPEQIVACWLTADMADTLRALAAGPQAEEGDNGE